MSEPGFECYVFYIVGETMDKGYRIMIFLAVLISILWCRFILMLQLTRKFGPMLRIIIVMIVDISKF